MEDKRKHPRINTITFISVMEISQEDLLQEHGHLGATVNLSKGGVLFESKIPIPLLSIVKLTMTLRDEVVEVEGRVVRLEELSEHKIAVAINFTEISSESVGILHRYLEEKSSEER